MKLKCNNNYIIIKRKVQSIYLFVYVYSSFVVGRLYEYNILPCLANGLQKWCTNREKSAEIYIQSRVRA